MFRIWTCRMMLSLGAVVLAPQLGAADFGRYQVILDRRPFGEVPAPDVVPAAVARPAGPSFADGLRLVAMTISQGDIRVGLVEEGGQSARSYFLFVGDAEDGLEVVSADYEAETVLLEKDGEQRILRMGGGGSSRPSQMGAGMITGSNVPETVSGRDRRVAIPRGRITEGRRQRLEEERRRAELVPELTGAVLERHLQEYNLQVIREGKPPLPIPLTPEQDAQLVEEGVLPPLD